MNILLLSAGGGGGNILRSVKRLFRRDLLVAQKANSKFAARLERSVVTRFLDTNSFSLADVPKDERLLIGPRTTRQLGSMHNPAIAKAALEESQKEVEALLAKHTVIVLVGTGGKGTGAGTLLPLARMARHQRKLVIPIFVRPSFERHEVEKPRYDHALKVVQGFDAAGIRLVEILNDLGYVEHAPQPQSVVWERMNLPIARALRGLLYVLSDLSQVDPSDLSVLFGGKGRLRIAFSEIDPPQGKDPGDDQIEDGVRACWDNPYCEFTNPVGSSLICIQGDWSNVADGRIKSRLATLALEGAGERSYNPLYARAVHTPRPWGITAIFAEHTGQHQPLEIDWPWDHRPVTLQPKESGTIHRVVVEPARSPARAVDPHVSEVPAPSLPENPAASAAGDSKPAFARFWDLAFALQRSDPRALSLASGASASTVLVESGEIRKLLGTMWFSTIFQHLSQSWRDRLLDVLVEDLVVPNHPVRIGRRTLPVSEVSLEDLKEVVRKTILPDAIHTELQLLVTIGHLWGAGALQRITYEGVPRRPHHSKLDLLLQAWRHT
jgi:cell division GTPase FtsZ